jgi:hypothetical protein
MQHNVNNDVAFNCGIEAVPGAREGVKSDGKWKVECFDKDGNLKWVDYIENMVVNAGLNHILSAVLAAGTQVTSWFVGLTDSTPTVAAADTMASHAGWVEVTDYTQANRVAFTPGTVASQSVDNSASKAQFSINATVTVGGAFLVSNNTKGGTTGTLYAVGAFTGGDRALQSGDTLNVQATFTQADDGV